MEMTKWSRAFGLLALPILLAGVPAMAAPTHMLAMTGQIRKVDATAHTVTVASLPGKKERQMTFHLASDAKIIRNEQTVPVAELKEGERVTVQYAREKGQQMAHSIALKSADPEPAKLGTYGK
jgi:Cu/Ag efflux protein CusF